MQSVAVEFAAKYQSTIWESDDQTVVIARVLDSGGQSQTVKGPLDSGPKFEAGLSYRFHGRWLRHEKHGLQFEFATYSAIEPHDRRGVIAYLRSVADNIGEKRAARLWDAFGEDAVEILRTQPERAVQADILSERDAAEAAQSLHDEAAFEWVKIDLLGLFAGRGFQAGKLIKASLARWGAKAPHFIRHNPYLLMMKKMPSCGFKRCDRLYLDLGYKRDRLKRQALQCWHTIHSDSTGHTWFPAKRIANTLAEALPGANPLRALKLALRAKLLAKHADENGEKWLAERKNANNEAIIADAVRSMTLHEDSDNLWPSAQLCSNLTDHQRLQLTAATAGRFGLLTGTPGTGKTFTTGSLVNVITEQHGMSSIAVCAPTGKAAVRVSAAMRRAGVNLRATTIHQLLEISRNGHDGEGWGFKRKKNNPLEESFIIVDEASMVDTDLAASLLDAVGPQTHVLWVGDPYQLPPVGHGAPLRDMIAAGVPNGHLTEIQRNAGLIVKACAAIKEGNPFETCTAYDPAAGQNLRHIETATPEEQLSVLMGLLTKLADNKHGWDLMWDVQVLIAVNEKGELARKPINRLLQNHLNASGCPHSDHQFRVGDKIICLRNHWALNGEDPETDPLYVANGEIGEVIDVAQPRKILARFGQPDRFILIPTGKKQRAADSGSDWSGNPITDGDDPDADNSSVKDFDLAYAITCHKSQGSEWPVVIVMLDSSSGARRVCSREWIYTAASRARDLCITVGRLSVAYQMAKRPTLERRKTFLAELIRRANETEGTE